MKRPVYIYKMTTDQT